MDDPELTAEGIKECDVDELPKWIQRMRNVLTDDDVTKLKEARISGRVFLLRAGDVDFFETKCGLAIRTCVELAHLAREIVEAETAGTVQKGIEQDTSTGKSTDHAFLSFSLY